MRRKERVRDAVLGQQSMTGKLVNAGDPGEAGKLAAALIIGAGIGGFSAQSCAEILLAEARAHLEGETSLEEVRFVLFGEPTYRVFEMALDAAKVQEQMERLRSRKS